MQISHKPFAGSFRHIHFSSNNQDKSLSSLSSDSTPSPSGKSKSNSKFKTTTTFITDTFNIMKPIKKTFYAKNQTAFMKEKIQIIQLNGASWSQTEEDNLRNIYKKLAQNLDELEKLTQNTAQYDKLKDKIDKKRENIKLVYPHYKDYFQFFSQEVQLAKKHKIGAKKEK